jgi:hypothetical protein
MDISSTGAISVEMMPSLMLMRYTTASATDAVDVAAVEMWPPRIPCG